MLKTLIMKAAFIAFVGSISFAAHAIADTQRFDVPAGDLIAALESFAKQADVDLVYQDEQVTGLRTGGVSGHFLPRDAVMKLLEGTSLQLHTDEASGALLITTPSPSGGPAPSTPATQESQPKPAVGVDSAAVREKRSFWSRFRLAQAETNPASQGSESQTSERDNAHRSSEEAEKNRIVLEEIIVTARKRAERLQDVPISIAVVTADDIDRRGLVGAADYLRGIPGVNQVDGRDAQAIVIRGIETTLRAQNFGAGPTTATYFGETPTTNSAGLLGANIDTKLVDIDRVEVLRGPQGTAFGNASMGGAVRTIPVEPKLDRFEGKLGAGYSATSGAGGDNYTFQAVGNAPLVADKLAIRGNAYAFSDSGFYRNRAGSDAAFQAAIAPFGGQAFAIDKEEVGGYYAAGARVAALFRASDNLRFRLNYLSQKTETDGYSLATSGMYEQTTLQVAPEHFHRGETGGFFDSDIDIANAVIEYDLGRSDLLATYSYLEGASTYVYSWTLFDLPWPISERGSLSHREHVGEIRLATNFDGAWNFLVGLYAEKSDDDLSRPADSGFVWYGDQDTNIFAPGERYLGADRDRRDLRQNAAFGEVSWEFLPGLTLTGGGRAYEFDRTVQVDSSGILFAGGSSQRDDDEASGANFRANLSYKPGDNTLLYGGWSQGFRLGKPQPAVPAAVCDTDGDGFIDGTSVTIESTGVVDSDAVDSYELGGKFALLGRRLTIESALFRMEWSDIPVFVIQPSCPSFAYLANVGAALSEGVEFQANFQVNEAWRVDFGGSWIDARLTKDAPTEGFSAGDRLPSPKVNANLALQYAFEIGGLAAFVRADSIYVGPFFGGVGESPNTKSGDYVKLDATARVAIGNLDIDLYVRNLTNEDAFTFRGSFVPTDFFGYRVRPRTVGLQFNYSFGR